MGNSSCKPNLKQKDWLDEHYRLQCKLASDCIKNGDILLLHIGAGFSADSGLAVYKDIADIPAYHKMKLKYHDLCTTDWINTNPGIFYGFWGKCFNDYRETYPHKGYNIIKNWKEQYYSVNKYQDSSYFPNEFARLYKLRLENIKDKQIGNIKGDQLLYFKDDTNPFFIFSSNVDSHPQKIGFNSHEIYEIHGSLENWQCSNPDTCQVIYDSDDPDLPTCYNGNSFTSKEDFTTQISLNEPQYWPAPKNYHFSINEDSMIAKDIKLDHLNLDINNPISKAFQSNFPRCIHCNGLARPNVLMFNDNTWIDDDISSTLYDVWRELVLDYCNIGKKLVILEIGCGTNVPTVRASSEHYLDIAPKDSVTLIRINPDFPLVSHKTDNNKVISIQEKGLPALEYINKLMTISENDLNYTPLTDLYDDNNGISDSSESSDYNMNDIE